MKKIISYCILLILIPAVVVGGALLFRDRQYAWVSLCFPASRFFCILSGAGRMRNGWFCSRA